MPKILCDLSTGRGAKAILVTALAAAGTAGLLAVAGPASAQTGRVLTSGVTLNVRSGPGTSYPVTASLAPNSTVSFSCYSPGTAVTGPYGTETAWDRLDSGGYVADAWIYTGSNAATVPVCGATATPAPSSGRAMGRTATRNNGVAGQCTYGAYEQWRNATGYYPLISGNAMYWAASARANGWTVVADAQPRSIVVFQPGVQGASSAGHVGWVTSTQRRSDGLYITFTEMNGTAGPYRYDQRTTKDIAGMSYILAP